MDHGGGDGIEMPMKCSVSLTFLFLFLDPCTPGHCAIALHRGPITDIQNLVNMFVIVAIALNR